MTLTPKLDSVHVQVVPTKTLIIGHTGRMGQMLMAESAAHNLEVVGLDQPFDQNIDLTNLDLAIFCVPALVLEQVLAKICPILPSSCIVADITSVKELPMLLMERAWGGAVIGTHPLFGPNLNRNEILPVAITPGQKTTTEALAKVTGFFTTLGFTVFRCEAKAHDLAMASLQNLNFITTLAYFALLAGHEELLPFLTPSFRRRMKAAKKMLTEDAPMFSGLFEANNNSNIMVRQYTRYLNLAAAGDIEVLCQKAKWWWDKVNLEDHLGTDSLGTKTLETNPLGGESQETDPLGPDLQELNENQPLNLLDPTD